MKSFSEFVLESKLNKMVNESKLVDEYQRSTIKFDSFGGGINTISQPTAPDAERFVDDKIVTSMILKGYQNGLVRFQKENPYKNYETFRKLDPKETNQFLDMVDKENDVISKEIKKYADEFDNKVTLLMKKYGYSLSKK